MNASKPLDDASKTPMILSKPKCVGYFGINTEKNLFIIRMADGVRQEIGVKTLLDPFTSCTICPEIRLLAV